MPETKIKRNIEEWRKKLVFRSWHRGTRETDLILGHFADAHVPAFDEEQLEQYETLLQNPDPDLYDWMTGRSAVPDKEDTQVMRLFVSFRFS